MPRPQDSFGKNAKKHGYPARSVYKLEEIDKRIQLFKYGQHVLDLGAVPGSWTLYASKRVGLNGIVVGIDIQQCKTKMPPNVSMRQADIFDIEPADIADPSSFHVVLSDMAPNTSGNRFRDQCLSYELYMRALNIANHMLRPTGSFVGKLFQGPDFEEARNATKGIFAKTRIVKPRASRRESYEVYLVGQLRKETPVIE